MMPCGRAATTINNLTDHRDADGPTRRIRPASTARTWVSQVISETVWRCADLPEGITTGRYAPDISATPHC
jgi:hypothetical protein